MKNDIIKAAITAITAMLISDRDFLFEAYELTQSEIVLDLADDCVLTISDLADLCAEVCKPVPTPVEEAPEFWVNTWGWEQTNVDFYMVTKRTAKSVTLIAVETERISVNMHYMSYKALPTTRIKAGAKPMRKKIYMYDGKEHCKAQYGCCQKWDGKAEEGTFYA